MQKKLVVGYYLLIIDWHQSTHILFSLKIVMQNLIVFMMMEFPIMKNYVWKALMPH